MTKRKRTWLILRAAVLLLAGALYAAYAAAPVVLVFRLSNDDIHWDGTYSGLMPVSFGWPARLILLRGRGCVPRLVRALDDDSRFAAAHVLLSYLLQSSRFLSGGDWDHLHVDLTADGRTVISTSQKAELKQLWRERQEYISSRTK